MTRPQKRKAPEALARPEAQESSIDSVIIVPLVDAIKGSVMAGEVVTATDYPESDRPLFWAAIARILDDMPCVRPAWRTLNEQHVDGIRTRLKMFRICPRQKGSIDPTLAGSIAVLAVCAWLMWWPL